MGFIVWYGVHGGGDQARVKEEPWPRKPMTGLGYWGPKWPKRKKGKNKGNKGKGKSKSADDRRDEYSE
jgi:hypothetical protein